MLDPVKKLAQFTAAIQADAMAESEKILSEVRQEVDTAMSAAEDEVLNETFRYIKNEVAHERTETGRRVSRRMMDNKNALNNRREEMANAVMDKVRARLVSYVQSDAYAVQMTTLAKEIITAFGNKETVFYLRPADKAIADVFKRELKDYKFQIAEGIFELGGLMASCPETHMQIDESFDTKYSELRGHFSELFGLQLAQ